jgi:hypothetical protein
MERQAWIPKWVGCEIDFLGQGPLVPLTVLTVMESFQRISAMIHSSVELSPQAMCG